ncbi:hypothetical protein [Aureimonas leprariae]|uniref:Uncharacterized protein n=1 Tax=Plantimonas leprariae TaxID=2615207 RepID=A0A7V7PMU7_9HYPH|nr:hypothetical protein [Aureimonas leprariae]KAB0678739.1 hypothetical protein F6X38_14720 [Aureimonas leprariae]
MSAMEKSLRRALDAGDAKDPAFRESIYAASERALERMLAQKPVDDAVAHVQRTRLAETINRVEDDFYARQTEAGAGEDGPAQHDPTLSLDPAYRDAHAYSTRDPGAEDDSRPANDGAFDLEPIFDTRSGDGPATGMAVAEPGAARAGKPAAVEPIHTSPRTRAADAAREATKRSNAQLRRFLLIALAVAAVLAAGIYFVYASASPSEPTGGADGAWIDLFDGKRLDALATPEGGRVEALATDATGGRAAVRFTPSGEAASLTVAVGEGVARSVDGRKVVVELAAGSPDGTARTFAVECRLGGRSVCGRQNFATARRSDTFVFDMEVPEGARAGDIAITPTEPSTAGLYLYAMRLRNG